MKPLKTLLIIALLTSSSCALVSCSSNDDDEPTTTKVERKSIKAGNKLFEDGKFDEAESEYRKALQSNPNSEAAMFNLGSALIGRAAEAEDSVAQKYLNEATKIMTGLADKAQNDRIRESANYDLGNLSFNMEQYKQAIEFYKQALRINPDNDYTRENLRLAQKKLEEQQDQNQDQNQDQDNQQNNQDKDKQDQDKQDQDKQDQDQNQDQNQDQQPPQPQPQDNSISDQNAEQILKAMENQENATRQRFNQQRQNGQPARRTHSYPW